jgi:hypothetical protein
MKCCGIRPAALDQDKNLHEDVAFFWRSGGKNHEICPLQILGPGGVNVTAWLKGQYRQILDSQFFPRFIP